MTAPLPRPHFEHLVAILRDHPDFATETGRLRLLRGALHGYAGAEAVLAGLNLAGDPRGAAVEVVIRLEQVGRLGERHALALLLESLSASLGDGDDQRRRFVEVIADLDRLPIEPGPRLGEGLVRPTAGPSQPPSPRYPVR